MKQGATSPKTLLRARGGISLARLVSGATSPSSPRTRRYFHPCAETATAGKLFSAHAEVFPIWSAVVAPGRLFSAHAEVFPSRSTLHCSTSTLLRARGGISIDTAQQATPPSSSPRTRRYFRGTHRRIQGGRLFSAHAEVFPKPHLTQCYRLPLLRARGGISF